MGEICKVDNETVQPIVWREIKKSTIGIRINFAQEITIKSKINEWVSKSKLVLKI